jgi:hypothetical protein
MAYILFLRGKPLHVLTCRPGRRAGPNGCYRAPAPRLRPGPRTVLLAGPLGYDPHGGAEGRRSDRGRSASPKTPRRAPIMSTSRAIWSCAGVLPSLGPGGADEADLILLHGKVVTVDRDFSVRQALAVKGDRLLRVGTDEEVLKTRGPRAAMTGSSTSSRCTASSRPGFSPAAAPNTCRSSDRSGRSTRTTRSSGCGSRSRGARRATRGGSTRGGPHPRAT